MDYKSKTVDIYIRTYIKDFDVLRYCLLSIKKYLSDYRKIIINVRSKELALLMASLSDLEFFNEITLIRSHNYHNSIDYCGQQICKLEADLYTDADYILFVDSDCIYNDHTSVYDYFNSETGKLYLLKTRWEKIPETHRWKKCLRHLGLLTDYELMRRLPQLYPVHVFRNIRALIENKCGKRYIEGILDIYSKCSFSEFNVIGSYIFLNCPEVEFVEYDPNKHQIKCTQVWSYENKINLLNKAKTIVGM